MERDPPGIGVGFRLRLGDLAGEEASLADGKGEAISPPPADDRETLRLMKGAARAEPDDPDYYYILGEALLRAGRAREALGACHEAVDRDPLNPDYRFALGCVLWRLGQAHLAEGAFRESVQRRPEDAASLNALGAALIRLDRAPEAVAVLGRALKIDPRLAEAHSNLGIARWCTGDHAAALRSLQRAVHVGPDEPELQRNLARAQAAMGLTPEAVSLLRSMIRRWRQRADLHLDLAEVLHDMGRHGEAARALDEAQRLDPAAIAGRARSREIRDALRLRAVRGEVARERGHGPGPLARLLSLPLDLIAALGSLRPRLKVAATLTLVVLAAGGWATWRLLPHYVTSLLIRDDITVIARAPVRDDDVVRDRLAHAVRRRGLEGRLHPERCRVDTRPGWRQISCTYAVEVDLLPGLRRALLFRIEVEEPYLVEPAPVVF
jgi:Flp pilus assembly protein TadD